MREPPTRLVRHTAGQALPTLQSPGCAGLRPASCNVLRDEHCPPCNHLDARASDPPRATYCGTSIARPAITWMREPPTRLVQRTAGRALPTLQSPRCASLRPASCNVLRGKPCLPCNHLGARASDPPRATYCGASIARPAITWVITWVRGSPARFVQRTEGQALPTLQSPGCAGLRPAWCDVLRGKPCLPCNHLGARASGPPGATYCGASLAYPAITWGRGPPARLVRHTAGQALPTLQSPGDAGLRPAWYDILRGKPCLPCNHLGTRASGPPGATYCGASIAYPAITWVRGPPARLVRHTVGQALPALSTSYLERASDLPMIPFPRPM